MKQIIPELLVDSMEESLVFYVGVLGFKAEVLVPEEAPVFAKLVFGEVQVMLYAREEFERELPIMAKRKTGGTLALYIVVESIEKWREKLEGKVTILQELHKTEYGTREVAFEELNGYVVVLVEYVK